MLLLSYTIYGTLRSEDYRRHLLDLTILNKSRRSSAQSLGIERANFWVDIRYEIVVAMTDDQPLIPVPLDWAISWKDDESGEDALGNHVLWILAGFVNLPYLR